jgi:hypothetical protein
LCQEKSRHTVHETHKSLNRLGLGGMTRGQIATPTQSMQAQKFDYACIALLIAVAR